LVSDWYKGNTERKAVPAALKLRLLLVLMKSKFAANDFPSNIQIAFDGLFGEGTTTKLRNSAILFLQWIVEHVRTD
jgi:proteasome component ECM29